MVGSVGNASQSVQKAGVNPYQQRQDADQKQAAAEARKAQENRVQPKKAESAGTQKSDKDANALRARELAQAAHAGAKKEASAKEQRGTVVDLTV